MGFAPHPVVPNTGGGAAATEQTTTSSSSPASLTSLDANHHRRPQPQPPGSTLEPPPSSRKHRSSAARYTSSSRPARLFQKLRHSLPVLTLMITPRCGRLPSPANSPTPAASRPVRRLTGTLFGRRKGRVALALQETPRCLPYLVVELALQTHSLLRELSNPAGARIVLETERSKNRSPAAARLVMEEAAWTMFCNGRKTGYAVRREASGEDLAVMETLRPVSMGAGVIPSSPAAAAAPGKEEDEVAYMRGCFDHFVGSRDSESLYMIAPQGGGSTGPELAVFFVRL